MMKYSITKSPLILPSLEEFLKKLRMYSKSSIVTAGTQNLWRIWTDNKVNLENRQLMNTYGSQIVLLALATANDHRHKELSPDDFYTTCENFLNITTKIHDEASFNECVAQEIIDAIYNIEGHQIPNDLLKLKNIIPACSVLSICRILNEQESLMIRHPINDFATAYNKLKLLANHLNSIHKNVLHKRNVKDILEQKSLTIFNMDWISFMRSALFLFKIGNSNNNYGKIDFNKTTEGAGFEQKFNCNLDTCRVVATRLSIQENTLRSWHENDILSLSNHYKKHFKNPLLDRPMINMQTRKNDMEFLIPSPLIFLNSAPNYMFRELLKHDLEERQLDSKSHLGISNALGEIIEDHIFEAFKIIFKENIVSRIEGTDDEVKADILIEHARCDLIFEIKSTMGTRQSQSLLLPNDLAKVWELLYHACVQCSESIKKHGSTGKTVIGIVIIEGYASSGALASFRMFAEKCSLFKKLDVDDFRFFSWEYLEAALAYTSVDKFIDALLKNKKTDTMYEQFFDSLLLEADKPAHAYEYLAEAKKIILGDEKLLNLVY